MSKMQCALLRFASALAIVCSLGADQCEAAEADNIERQFLSQVRQLTFEGKRSGEGYFSPDGRALVFQSEREQDNPFYQIYLLDLETGNSRRLSPGIGKTTCAFFRPGTDDVLFASTHVDPLASTRQQEELARRASGQERRYAWDYDAEMELFVARRDGSNLRQLSHTPGYDAEGAYSPDGSKIVFCSLRSAYPTNELSAEAQKRIAVEPAWFGEIYIMNADGSEVRRLTRSPGYDGGPFFSPDGQRIVWRRFDEKGVTADIFTMKLDGSDVRRLTDFGAMSWAPFYHPSGRYIIFTSNKLGFGNFELYLVDADGRGEPVRVSSTDGFDGLPVFSPEGARLCWTSGRTTDNKSQLFLARWNHETALQKLLLAPARTNATTTKEDAHAHDIRTAPLSSAITLEDLQQEVAFLASAALAGRKTGSEGARAASSYLAEMLKAAGLKPAGPDNSFFQSFEFNAGATVVTNQNLFRMGGAQIAAREYQVERDFRPLSFSGSAKIEGPLVFVGYGLSVPGKLGEGYDSYAGLDVSNKIVLALRYVPEDVEAKRRQELNRYAGLRYKAMIARERGAKGILFVAGPNSPNAGELVELTFDSSSAGSGIVALSVSSNLVTDLLEGTGRNLNALQSGLDNENPHAESGFVISNLTVTVQAAVDVVKATDRNVLAALPAKATPTEFVLVGAHYDHLGYGEAGAMLRQGEEGKIHPGADDNASGTALILEVAAALAAEPELKLRRGVVFALWSGEEIGLIGSSHFANRPPIPLSNIVAYVNFDMVGRLRENKLNLQGIGSSGSWRGLIERRNVPAGFDLLLQDDPYLPTDSTAFYPKGVPVLSFFTGSHDDYHRPTDTADTVNYEGLKRIADFARNIITDLAQAEEKPIYVNVERSTPAGGSRETLRAYLGTIPDYTAEVAGVKLSGVRGKSPADVAGLKADDVVVAFAGQKIANIYDYTYALDAVKIGQPVKVRILRAGKEIELIVTPEARK